MLDNFMNLWSSNYEQSKTWRSYDNSRFHTNQGPRYVLSRPNSLMEDRSTLKSVPICFCLFQCKKKERAENNIKKSQASLQNALEKFYASSLRSSTQITNINETTSKTPKTNWK